MVKKELSETEIAESIPDLWQPLTQEQREFLAQNFTIQKYKKNETIYCEGETPMHLMCLLSGKVKIYKEGVGGRSQIIRVLKTKEYFAYRAYFAEGNFVTAAPSSPTLRMVFSTPFVTMPSPLRNCWPFLYI